MKHLNNHILNNKKTASAVKQGAGGNVTRITFQPNWQYKYIILHIKTPTILQKEKANVKFAFNLAMFDDFNYHKPTVL